MQAAKTKLSQFLSADIFGNLVTKQENNPNQEGRQMEEGEGGNEIKVMLNIQNRKFTNK